MTALAAKQLLNCIEVLAVLKMKALLYNSPLLNCGFVSCFLTR